MDFFLFDTPPAKKIYFSCHIMMIFYFETPITKVYHPLDLLITSQLGLISLSWELVVSIMVASSLLDQNFFLEVVTPLPPHFE